MPAPQWTDPKLETAAEESIAETFQLGLPHAQRLAQRRGVEPLGLDK
jgi:hypothetical protein